MTDDKLLERLAKLQKKADQIRAQMKAQKARAAKAERRNDTRRKILTGALLQHCVVQYGDDPRAWPIPSIRALLDKRLADRAHDRALFEGRAIDGKPAEPNQGE